MKSITAMRDNLDLVLSVETPQGKETHTIKIPEEISVIYLDRFINSLNDVTHPEDLIHLGSILEIMGLGVGSGSFHKIVRAFIDSKIKLDE